jgi:dihydroxy-acid dehydratase
MAMENRTGLPSQMTRQISYEGDALRLAMDWSVEDLERPQILVETTAGQSHPSSYHLGRVADEVAKGVWQSGGKPAIYTATDICDGVAQAHPGMHYALLTRELLVGLVEAHQKSTPFDGMVLSSSGDKAIPAHLMALARLNVPGLFVPGGAMASGPDQHTNDELWHLAMAVAQGELEEDAFFAYQRTVCPSCGACQYMGTAGTMQVMTEALGLSLTGSALIPATLAELGRSARRAGTQVLNLLRDGIRPRDILTPEAFENAMAVHAAINGSLNAVMHLIAIAREAGVDLDPSRFDRIARRVPVLVDTKSSGRFSTELFWYAGGVPAVMSAIQAELHLDALTVTGKTLGDNLKAWVEDPFPHFVKSFLRNYGLTPADVIHDVAHPLYPQGAVAVLTGNLAPDGALVKVPAVAPEMLTHQGPARVFDREQDAVAAIRSQQIRPGDVLVIRYQGPKATGMPEMFYPSELLASHPVLSRTTALVTDGRFSGATKGPCVGYIAPEALEGGPLAAVHDGDLIRIDIPGRRLDLVTKDGGGEAGNRLIRSRLERWQAPGIQQTGILEILRLLMAPALRGARIESPGSRLARWPRGSASAIPYTAMSRKLKLRRHGLEPGVN